MFFSTLIVRRDNGSHRGTLHCPAHGDRLPFAEVAELADALASGASDRKVMGVRVPPSAPFTASPGVPAASRPMHGDSPLTAPDVERTGD